VVALIDERYCATADPMRLVYPDDPAKGLRFDGRLSEDFNLSTGTWGHAANLRLDMLGVLAPFAADVVMTGAGRDDVGLLLVPNRAALDAAGYMTTEIGGALIADDLFATIRARLESAAQGKGSATRVTRALILAEPPSMADGEATAKGNINFPKLLERRAALVEQLYDDTAPASITI